MAKTTYSREELESQLAESRREFWAADATINNLEMNLAEMAARLANAENKFEALAAELRAAKLRQDANSARLHDSEPETDNTAQQFESLSRGDK